MKLKASPNVTELVQGRASKLDRWLRVRNRQAIFSKMYQYGVWDGMVHFFDLETRLFPTGLLPLVETRCREEGIPFDVTYTFKRPELEPLGEDFLLGITLRDYQLAGINACLKQGIGCVEAATGSGKTAMIAAVAGAVYLQHGIRSIIFVPKAGLLVQTVAELSKFLGPDVDIGSVGGGKREVNADIVVCTPQTLRFALPEKVEYNRKKPKVVRKHEPALKKLVEDAGCLILDESHHSSSDTWFELAKMCSAPLRFAFSGTPEKGKKWEDRRLWGVVKEKIYRVTPGSLVRRKILAEPTIFFVTDEEVFGRRLPNSRKYQDVFSRGLVKNGQYNHAIANITKHLVAIEKPPLILTTQVAHIQKISKALRKKGVPFEILYGKHNLSRRTSVKERFKEGENFALISSTIFDEGEDVPNIASLILAGGGKTPVALKQRIGRGMRLKKDNRIAVFDFIHAHSRLLAEHALNRFKVYQKEGFEIVEVDNVLRLSHYDL